MLLALKLESPKADKLKKTDGSGLSFPATPSHPNRHQGFCRIACSLLFRCGKNNNPEESQAVLIQKSEDVSPENNPGQDNKKGTNFRQPVVP